MSKGKIIKPKNAIVPNEVLSKPIVEIIYHAVQSCEVEVDNNEWQDADNKIKEEIKTSNETASQKIKNIDDKVSQIEKKIGDNQGNISDELKELKQEIENIKSRKPLDIFVTINSEKGKDLGKQHKQFPLLLKILATKLNVYIVGPAGSGKTTAALFCAKALNTQFHFTGAVASEFKLTGFIDAQGRIVSTEFRKAYENGGLFLFDEIDASYPQAVLAFNAALSNDYMDFPDKRVERHKNFYCIAAANTYGQGADRQYIGRNQLDAASLDRFVFLDWGYDENLERELAGNNDWTDHVQKIRAFVVSNKIRHVVSPRASIFGAKLLASGIENETVENTVIWKGLDEATKQKIRQHIEPKEEILAPRNCVFIPQKKSNTAIGKGETIGVIEFENRNHYQKERQNIISPVGGKIIFIAGHENLEKDDVIAEIKINKP
jgi:cobaltochelatase CobS